MAYVPYAPVSSLPSPGALTGQTSGTITTFDLSPELNAIGYQIGQLAYFMAGGATGETTAIPGSIPAILSAQAAAINQIMLIMQKATNTQDGHVTVVTDQTEKLTTALATVSGLLSQMLVTQQMAVIDQIHNNQFQQQVTNQSRTEAGLSTITVQDSDLLTKIKSNVTNVGTFQGQVAGSSAAIGAITQAGSQALSYTTTWLGSTVIGSWFVDQYTAMKLKIASAFGINQGVNDTSTAGVSTTNAAKIVTSSAPVYNTSTTS